MKNIICFGDSITQARNFPENNKWPTILSQLLHAEKIDYEVYNKGISGNTTAQAYDRFEEDVLQYLPAYVLIEFGFNDANVRSWAQKSRVGLEEFAANIEHFAKVISLRQSIPILIKNHSILPGYEKQGNGVVYGENFAPYNEKITEIAAKKQIHLIDLPKMMEEQNISITDFLSEDGLHLSTTGNHLYAKMVFTFLKESVLTSA